MIGSPSLPTSFNLKMFFFTGVRIGRKKIDVIHKGKPLQGTESR